MIRSLGKWIEHRTGLGSTLHYVLYERVPGGARWRYVWGSTLAFAFFVQLVTGIILWACYSPATTTAWGSVYHIQYEMTGGWFLRGIHHFMAQAMVVLLALHLLQVVWDGAYRAPREVNFWLGLVLMLIVLALSLTGYLLPWDQKGYWATRVATNLVGITPVVGGSAQELIVGGPDYSHATLTRFFALHAGVLPGLLIVFLIAHLALFRRHGLCAKQPLTRPDAPFWPDQVLRDAVACLAVAAVVGGLSWYFHGAELTAPADGARQYSAARPEWYFLFLFQFLKLFHGETGEIIGAIVVPGIVMLLLFAMPIIGRGKPGHYFNVGLLFVLFAGIVYLTVAAMQEDAADAQFQNARWVAEQEQDVAISIAASPTDGIPSEGARQMMREHPKGVAVRVFMDECLQCHNYQGSVGEGFLNANPTASNLWNFGRQEWVRGMLDHQQIVTPEYFGATPLAERSGGMVEFLKSATEGGADVDPDAGVVYSSEELDKIAWALQGRAGLQMADDQQQLAAEGEQLLIKENGCTNCHKIGEAGYLGSGPDLTDWGSPSWIEEIVRNPNHERMYGYLNDWGEGESQTMIPFGQEAAPESGYDDDVIREIARWLHEQVAGDSAKD